MQKTKIYTICLIIYIVVFVSAVFLVDDFSSLGGDCILAMLALLVYLLPVVIYRYLWYQKHKAPVTKIAALKFRTYYGLGASIVILLILDSTGDSLKPGFIACITGLFMTSWLLTFGEKVGKDKSK